MKVLSSTACRFAHRQLIGPKGFDPLPMDEAQSGISSHLSRKAQSNLVRCEDACGSIRTSGLSGDGALAGAYLFLSGTRSSRQPGTDSHAISITDELAASRACERTSSGHVGELQ